MKKNENLKGVVNEVSISIISAIEDIYAMDAIDTQHIRGRLSRYVSANDAKGLNDILIRYVNRDVCTEINEKYQKLDEQNREAVFADLLRGFAEGVI